MNCVICHSDDHRVIETVERDDAIRRRRKCERCGHRWTTFERVDAPAVDREALLAAVTVDPPYPLPCSLAWLRAHAMDFLHPRERIVAALKAYTTSAAPLYGGVYLLANGEDILYVGISTCIRHRLLQHQDGGVIRFDRFFCFPAPRDHAEAIEGFYIYWLEPPFNMRITPQHSTLIDLVRKAEDGTLWN